MRASKDAVLVVLLNKQLASDTCVARDCSAKVTYTYTDTYIYIYIYIIVYIYTHLYIYIYIYT